MLKALFVDIDGTLLDFDAFVRETMASGFRKFGLSPYEDSMFSVFNEVNSELWQKIEQGLLSLDELREIRWNSVFSRLGINGDGAAFEDYFRSCLYESAIPIPGADSFLREVSAKTSLILCAASNGPLKQQINRLRRAGFQDAFSYLFVSEALGAQKPDRSFFLRAFELLNRDRQFPILPFEAAILGDSLSSDIAGGLSFGMTTLLFDRDDRYADRPTSAHYRVTGLKEAAGILVKLSTP